MPRTFQDHEYPCRKLPQSRRCDRRGPGGFMGHTCVQSAISRLDGEIKGASIVMDKATQAKASAEFTIARMQQRIDGLRKERETLI